MGTGDISGGCAVNLILLEPEELTADGLARLTGDRARHLNRVLHAVAGSSVRVGLVNGPVGAATVRLVGDEVAELECVFGGEIPTASAVDLLLAVPRPKVLRRLWAQLAALGVRRIILTNAERVERNYFDTHVLEADCYRPLLIEGLQQARDTRLPEVSVHRRFRVLVEDDLDRLCPEGVRLVAHPAETRSPADALRDRQNERVVIAIGPEGGWNEFELELLAAHGFTSIGMGARALRSDTACVALLAMVHDALRR